MTETLHLRLSAPQFYPHYQMIHFNGLNDQIQNAKIRNPWPRPQGVTHQGRPQSEICNQDESEINYAFCKASLNTR